jgi:two-component system, chemotaxis family, chemotaxis protein CheY
MFPVDSKILIVDDSNFARSSLKHGLVHLKLSNVLEATNVFAAQRLLMDDEQVKSPVNLLITDLHMPDQSGFELVRWIRANERIKSMPVIILTSSQDKTEILEAGKLGVSHFMIKPFDNAKLKDKLISTWQKHGQKYADSIRAGGIL